MSDRKHPPASDRHLNKKLSFRPDADEVASARAELNARNRDMGSYLRACLRLLGSNPTAALAVLDDHWPPPRPTGRPARQPEPPHTQPEATPN